MTKRMLLLLVALGGVAHAHKPSESHLTLAPAEGAWRGRWDVALRDVEDAIGIDQNGDGALTWGEVESRAPAIAQLLTTRLVVSDERGACALETGSLALVEQSDGAYAAVPLVARCPGEGRSITVDDRLLFDVDADHRAWVTVGGETQVLARNDGPRTFAPAPRPSWLGTAASFVGLGARHIAEGIDHILFLVALLLPAVLRRERGRWVPVKDIRSALVDVVKVVSAFTVAHSITLSAAALGLVRVSAAVVEPAIAASVALAAAHNLRPVLGGDRWVIAFTLGLLHGFGFSSALADAGLTGARLGAGLFGFNLGVELGQLTLVAVLVPLAFLVKHRPAYRRLALVGGSLATTAVALVWFIERLPLGAF